MRVPEFETQEEYFDCNKKVWEEAKASAALVEGQQVIVECMVFPKDGVLDPASKDMGMIPLHYRATFNGMKGDTDYCELKTLSGQSFCSMQKDQLRLVPEEYVWNMEESKKNQYWRVSDNGDLSYTCQSLEMVGQLIDSSFNDWNEDEKKNVKYTIEPVWMTEVEYYSLPEDC